MDTDYIHLNAISTCQLSLPIPVFNVDGSANEAGEISEVAEVLEQAILHHWLHLQSSPYIGWAA
jgi:hypothetical protein